MDSEKPIIGGGYVCKALDAAEVAVVLNAVIAGDPKIPYFADKRPDLFIPKWTKFIEAGIARSYGAFCDGKPVGLILGVIMPDLISDTIQATEYLWQVIPKYRKTGAGITLLKMLEKSAKRAGCKRIVFGASTEFEFESMKRLYRRLGYNPVSMGMAKTLN